MTPRKGCHYLPLDGLWGIVMPSSVNLALKVPPPEILYTLYSSGGGNQQMDQEGKLNWAVSSGALRPALGDGLAAGVEANGVGAVGVQVIE